MKTATKKINSLFFLLLGCAPLLFVLLFSFKQQSIRRRMKARMENHLLHAIVIPDADQPWAKEGKEIWIKGRMFDILSVEQKNGTTILHGLFDEEETTLVDQLQEEEKRQSSPGNNMLVKFFQSLQFASGETGQRTVPLFSPSHLELFPGPYPLAEQFIAIITPPPQFPGS